MGSANFSHTNDWKMSTPLLNEGVTGRVRGCGKGMIIKRACLTHPLDLLQLVFARRWRGGRRGRRSVRRGRAQGRRRGPVVVHHCPLRPSAAETDLFRLRETGCHDMVLQITCHVSRQSLNFKARFRGPDRKGRGHTC